MFPEQQISILVWFLKDRVTLKPGVMMLKIQLCRHRNNLHFDYFYTHKCSLDEQKTLDKTRQKVKK